MSIGKVKDFKFDKSFGYTGSTGKVVEKATGEKYPSKAAMAKHEKGETAREQKAEAYKCGGKIKK